MDHDCPACGAAMLEVLGVLGTRVHFRCRCCGALSSFKLPR
jgi:uncharacterized Zn finger protein